MTVPPMEDAAEAVTTTIDSSCGGITDLEAEGRVAEVGSPSLDRKSAPRRCSEFICVDFDAKPQPNNENPSAAATTSLSTHRSKPPPSTQQNAPRCCLMELGKCPKRKKGADDGARGDLEETTTTTPLPTETKSPSVDHGADTSNSGGTSADDDEYSEDEELNYRSIRDVSYTPTVFQMYAPPRQRQEWGQKQILPRVNWGDLFFGTCPFPLGLSLSHVTHLLSLIHLDSYILFDLPRSLLRGGCLQCKETTETHRSKCQCFSVLLSLTQHTHCATWPALDRLPIFSSRTPMRKGVFTSLPPFSLFNKCGCPRCHMMRDTSCQMICFIEYKKFLV